MRIGKWQKIYENVIPLPETLSTAFGLTNGSQLHVAPLKQQDENIFDAEIVVSPVPVENWGSAVRLSVRLQHCPKALSIATKFLKDENINILLTEACATYKERAHWDAICDVSMNDGFKNVSTHDRKEYKEKMNNLLEDLNTKLKRYIEEETNQKFFLSEDESFSLFSTLPGLNDAHFNCELTRKDTRPFQSGAITLPSDLRKYVQTALGINRDYFPHYAIITGNTEQRYLVIWFINDYQNLFITRIDNKLENLAGKGIGVLHQILDALPDKINLLKIANYVTEKTDKIERGRLELLGKWPQLSQKRNAEKDFRDEISALVIMDTDGHKKSNTLEVVDFINPEDDMPRIYISYSTNYEKNMLDTLYNALVDIDFEPIMGTRHQEYITGVDNTAPTIIEQSFSLIPTCAAFISLQVCRDDFKCGKRYLLSPWAIAEEVYAWKSEVGKLIRLRDVRIESPRWHQNIQHFDFCHDNVGDFNNAVAKLIAEMKEWKKEKHGRQSIINARKNLFKLRQQTKKPDSESY